MTPELTIPIWILGYAGALIDGEGYIGARENHKDYQYGARVTICMTERASVDLIAKHFGGKVNSRKPTGFGKKPMFYWEVVCKDACRFLELILPYLVLKKNQAMDIILLEGLQDRKRNGYFKLVSEGEKASRKVIYTRIRERSNRRVYSDA